MWVGGAGREQRYLVLGHSPIIRKVQPERNEDIVGLSLLLKIRFWKDPGNQREQLHEHRILEM